MEHDSNEANILSLLNKHRSDDRNHTIPILDICSTQDCQLVVMPLYNVLHELGKQDRIKYYNIRDQILEVNTEFCGGHTVWMALLTLTLFTQGVAFLHEHGIAHRDLNPNNIVWNPSTGRVFIIDFDLSLHLDPPQLIVNSSGTKGYIAPEVEVKDKPHDPFKADLWSLGATLTELAKVYYLLFCSSTGTEGN